MRFFVFATALMGFFALASVPSSAEAAEIQYGAVHDSKGDTVVLRYKGPAGEQFFRCSLSGNCGDALKSAPDLFPNISGASIYPKNTQGTRGVRIFMLGTMRYYFLYDLTGEKPKRLERIPYTLSADEVIFSPSGNQVLLRQGSTFTRYDLTTKKISRTTVPQSELPFRRISWNATYLAAYNYSLEAVRLWRLSDGKEFRIAANTPSYFEMNEAETRGAYLTLKDGYKTLHVLDLKTLSTPAPRAITRAKTVVEDYLFVDNTLFYIANPEHPLIWSLYRFDEKTDASTLIEKDVSYGDYLKHVAGKLAYLKTTGKNTNVVLYDPTEQTKIALAAVKDSPASEALSRKPVRYGGLYGALLTPEKPARKPSLFVWLHGGPQRQTSVGYHSYLSYAVYDEILEKIAAGGHYVLKLDYPGSTGYGSTFEKALQNKIGVADVAGVRKAVDALAQDIDVEHTYLIGNSYGGYLALRALVAHPSEFDGAISINGVTDWYGLISRIPSSPFRTLFEGVPDLANLNRYLAASVFTGMEKLDGQPVLIVYGTEDSTVPPDQSRQYLTFAKTRDVSVHELALATEGHILTRRQSLDALCKKIVSVFSLSSVSCRQ